MTVHLSAAETERIVAGLPEERRRQVSREDWARVLPGAMREQARRAGGVNAARLADRPDYERALFLAIQRAGLPEPDAQVRFDQHRRFRLDFAYVAEKVGIEIHGATWAQGRHTRGSGFHRDRGKMNLAQLQGWLVLELVPDDITSGAAIHQIAAALRGK